MYTWIPCFISQTFNYKMIFDNCNIIASINDIDCGTIKLINSIFVYKNECNNEYNVVFDLCYSHIWRKMLVQGY